jgi:hypothetical protein
MANTISNISLANTFGEWVSTTVQTVNELNFIGNSDWRKPTGTIYLESNGTSLDVANNTFFRGGVTIIGTNSSLTVHKNQAVHGTLFLTNTDVGANPNKLIFSANGVANVNYVNIIGTGLAANVSNNMSIGGTLTIGGNTTISQDLVVSDDITSDNQTINFNLNVGDDLTVGNDLSVSNNFEVDGDSILRGLTSITGSLIVSGQQVVNNLTSNNNILTVSLNSSNKSWLNDLQSNNSVNTSIVTASNSIIGGQLISNTSIVAGTNIAANTGYVFANNITSNTITSTGSITAASIGASIASFDDLVVSGDFTVTGNTIYDTDVFTLRSTVPMLPSEINFAAFNINRGESENSANANASIRWDNTNKYWAVRDVDNPAASGFGRILSANDYVSINTSISTANTNMKNYVDSQDLAYSQNANLLIVTANTNMKNYVDVANTSMKSYVDFKDTSLQAQITANSISANAMIVAANSAMKTYVDGNFLKISSGGPTQMITSDVTITGNLIINGATTTVNTTVVQTTDSLIKLAQNNTAGDSVDIGFYGPYQSGGFTRYTGLFRKASDKYYLVQGVTTDPTANTIDQYGVLYRATLDSNIIGNVTGNLTGNVSGILTGSVNGNVTGTLFGNATGNAGSVTNGVYTIGDQNISGSKTFISTIIGSITGNAGTVTNGVYTTGDQSISGTKTFSSTISGNINGNSATSTLAAKSSTLAQNGANGAAMTFFWSGQSGQPTWVWGGSDGTNFYVYNPSNFNVNFASTAGNITAFTINQNLGTGNNVQHNSLGIGTAASGTEGEIRATNNITAFFSDRRLKENIIPINDAISKVLSISGVTFNSNDLAESYGYTDRKTQVGVIAQEIEAVLPQIVVPAPFDIAVDEQGNEYSKSGENFKTVQYEKIIPLLIEAIKELNSKVEELLNK